MTESLASRVPLRDGNSMPGFGLGVFRAEDGSEVEHAVQFALNYGYRMVDTASFYHNERGVGKGVYLSDVDRAEVFLTTKIWPTQYDNVQRALEESLRLLKADYVDLYLMHWPGPDETLRCRTWERMLELRERGYIRSCGVSNFYRHHLDSLEKHGLELPVCDQVECHPWEQRRAVRAYCAEKDIVVTAWGPLMHGHLSEEPLLEEIGRKYGKSAAQVALRWAIQEGVVPIPKSVHDARIVANADVFDFVLNEDDLLAISGMDGKGSFAFDADTFNGILDS